MGKTMWLLSSAPIDICLRFAIFFIEMLGYHALLQLFHELQ